MLTFRNRRSRAQVGATTVEMALIIGLIALAIGGTVGVLRGRISGTLVAVGDAIGSSGSATTTTPSLYANMTLVATQSGGVVTVTVTGGPNQTGSYLVALAPANDSPNSYPMYYWASLTNGSGSFTFSGAGPGSWVGRFLVALNTGWSTVKESAPVTVSASAMSISTSISGGSVTLNITNGPEASGSYLIALAPSSEPANTYPIYQWVSFSGGSATVTFQGVPNGIWVGRFLLSLSSGWTNSKESAPFTISSSPIALNASVSGDTVSVAVSDGPTGTGSFLVALAPQGAPANTYPLYVWATLSNGSGNFSFSAVPTGTWVARFLVAYNTGWSTVKESAPVTISASAMTINTSVSGDTVTVTVANGPTASGSYLIALAAPSEPADSYPMYQYANFTNGGGVFTFQGVPAGAWVARSLVALDTGWRTTKQSGSFSVSANAAVLDPTVSGTSVSVSVTGGPSASGSYLIALAPSTDPANTYPRYQWASFANGATAATFTGLTPGTWVARILMATNAGWTTTKQSASFAV